MGDLVVKLTAQDLTGSAITSAMQGLDSLGRTARTQTEQIGRQFERMAQRQRSAVESGPRTFPHVAPVDPAKLGAGFGGGFGQYSARYEAGGFGGMGSLMTSDLKAATAEANRLTAALGDVSTAWQRKDYFQAKSAAALAIYEKRSNPMDSRAEFDEMYRLQGREAIYQRQAELQARHTQRQMQLLLQLGQAEDAATSDSMERISRTITAEETAHNKRVGFQARQEAGNATAVNGIKKAQFAVQQAVFGLDDAMTGAIHGGFRGAIMGAGNNLTMLASMLGGVSTQLAVIGGVAAAQIGVRLYESFTKAKDGAGALLETLNAVRTSVGMIGSGAVGFRFLDEETEDQSSRRLSRLKSENEATLAATKDREYRLNEQRIAAQSLADKSRSPDSTRPAHLRVGWASEEKRLQAQQDAQKLLADIDTKDTANRDLRRRAEEFLRYLKENKSIEKAAARESAEAAEKATAEAESDARKREKLAKDEERRQKAIARGQKELAELQQKQGRFTREQYGDTGAREAVLAEMQQKLVEARELFAGRPGQLAQAETNERGIAAERLAQIALRDRAGRDSQLRAPSFAQVESDRARSITLGAGNQLLNAAAKEDKHRSAMEQLTADTRDGIKELIKVAERDREITVVLQ